MIDIDRYDALNRLCLVGSCLMFSRYFLSIFEPRQFSLQQQHDDEVEWMRGPILCTYSNSDLMVPIWSVPMTNAGYFTPTTSLHFLMLQAPLLVLIDNWEMLLRCIVLIVTGPVLTVWLTMAQHHSSTSTTTAAAARPVIWGILACFQVRN